MGRSTGDVLLPIRVASPDVVLAMAFPKGFSFPGELSGINFLGARAKRDSDMPKAPEADPEPCVPRASCSAIERVRWIRSPSAGTS